MIRGEKIDLRPLTEADLPLLTAWENDRDFQSAFNWFGLGPAGALAREFARDGILAADHGLLVIVARDGAVIGELSYRQVVYGPNQGSRAYQIGLTIAPEQRGRGYGSEAQRLAAAYLLETYPVMRVEASTDSTNSAEQRALEKAGFTREGLLRRAQWRAGAWHDLVVYSKLRGE
jgi:aminoglycoside 6'-N-acetyltransferase